MKKLIALLLAAMVGISLALCSCDDEDKNDDDSNNKEIVGGWTAPDSPVITEEVKAVLSKATAEMTGGTYQPVAYLGSQVVAGTNHRILCTFKPSAKKAKTTYAIVTVYEDLSGNAEITEILNSKAEVLVTKEATDGGWTAPASPEITKEVADTLAKATEKTVGAAYSPVVLLGTQVVAGTNYSILCEVTPVTENPEAHYAVVTVYQGADGTASVLETVDFTAAE